MLFVARTAHKQIPDLYEASGNALTSMGYWRAELIECGDPNENHHEIGSTVLVPRTDVIMLDCEYEDFVVLCFHFKTRRRRQEVLKREYQEKLDVLDYNLSMLISEYITANQRKPTQ